jgi:signal transduction histidine kinase
VCKKLNIFYPKLCKKRQIRHQKVLSFSLTSLYLLGLGNCCEFIIYPRPRTDAMETTYQLLVQKDYPHLLRPVALKFNHRSEQSPYCKPTDKEDTKGEKTFMNDSELFESIIAVLPLHLFWKDIFGNYKGCNNQQAKSLGLKSRKDIVHCTPYAKLPKETAEKLRQNDLEIIQNGEAGAHEEPGIRNDGSEGVFLTHKIPLKNATAEVIGLLGVSMDITDIKALQKKLKIERDHAKQADKLKAEFISNMEHDIRTPFCGICGLNELLAERTANAEDKRLLLMAVESGKRLLAHCNDILQFSKHQKPLPVIAKKFDLKKTIDDVVKIEMPAAMAKKLELRFDYPSSIPTIVIGDEYRISRILLNLISNAVKFTEQGYVSVKTHFAKREKRHVVIDLIIEDTGIGIPPEKQNVIYEKFVKGTESNKGLYAGTGLGLYYVKKFIHELDGDIEFKTGLEGTTFVCSLKFKLPLHDDLL